MKLLLFLESIVYLDWKPYALSLIGFLGGAISNQLGERYGLIIGLTIFMGSWWLVLIGLTLAHRKADLEIYKIWRAK